MRDKPIPTRPMAEHEKMLREKFYISITTQSDLLDKLSERLLTLAAVINPARMRTDHKFGVYLIVDTTAWLA